jgi:peptidoglycan/xylan/chitin deacetylase (PgdA/CDA1 family)
MNRQALAILGYHNIGPPSPGGWETWYYIPEETFAAQLGYLQSNGWQVLNVKAFVDGLANPASLPEKSALLTFDDGHRLMLGSALRQLRKFGFPGVLFVPTDYIGGTNRYDANTREPPEAVCDWEDLRNLERQGVSIQSHGASHRTFSDLTSQELDAELLGSKSVLEQGLDRQVELFAYPYGDGGLDVEAVGQALTRCGYRAACLYDGGLNYPPDLNPFRLHRLYMGAETNLEAELAGLPAE